MTRTHKPAHARGKHAWRSKVVATIAACLLAGTAMPVVAEDHPATHNMLVFGRQTVFFSHLPMFDGADRSGAKFTSPHRYQLILEAAFTDEQLLRYLQDRVAHPQERLYTLGPDEQFVIGKLFTPAGAPQLTSFTATVSRGHLEHASSRPVPGLERVVVKVARVIHARELDPRAVKPEVLEYLLIGGGHERYLAHAIYAPPDFDQVLQVNMIAPEIADCDATKDVRLTIPGRRNEAAARLRAGQRVEAMARMAGGASTKVMLEVGPEIYFEEGELMVPPTFATTENERNE